MTICGQRQGKTLIPFSDEDLREIYKFPENQFLEIKIKGSKKERSYRELCLYFSSCTCISRLNLNANMDTKEKVDYLTRLKCGFVDGTVFDGNGLLHWMVRSLSYDNCDHPDAHKFINQALESHAELVGIFDVEEYKKHLKNQ